MRELSLESRRREVEKSANLGRQEAASAVDEAHWHSDHFKIVEHGHHRAGFDRRADVTG